MMKSQKFPVTSDLVVFMLGLVMGLLIFLIMYPNEKQIGYQVAEFFVVLAIGICGTFIVEFIFFILTRFSTKKGAKNG